MRQPQRILVIGLSNIGDTILMLPVIAHLHERFPQAQLTLLIGERAQALLTHDPRVQRLVCIDEFAGWLGRLRLVRLLWGIRPDVLIDLRHTLLPFVWRPWQALRYVWPVPPDVVHMRDRHLWKLKTQGGMWNGSTSHTERCTAHDSVWIPDKDRQHVDRLMARWHLDPPRPFVVMCPGARSYIKRWYADRFAKLADRLIEEANVEVVFTGEPEEAQIVHEVLSAMHHPAHSALGLTTLQQLAALMQRARLVITNDSASLHLACAVNTPVLALFGPTDPRKYGPTGQHDRVIQRKLFCAPCEQALCRFSHECMRFISADEVVEAARQMLLEAELKRKTPPDL